MRRDDAGSRQQPSSGGWRSSCTRSVSALLLIVLLMPTLSRSDDRLPEELAAARADTIATLMWLLEDERHQHKLELLACETHSDSLAIEIRYKERVEELTPRPSSLKPWMIFVAGVIVGGGYAVLVMHAVN